MVLFGYELLVASKQGVRCDDSPKCKQSPSANYLCFGCQASMLAGCKQDAIFTDLLAKLSNFGLQVFNDLVLRAVKELCMDPSRLPRSAFVATVDRKRHV